MKTKIPIKFKFIIIAHFLLSSRLIAQENPKWIMTGAFNGTEAQLSNSVHHSWGYSNINIDNSVGSLKNSSYSISAIPKYLIKDQLYFRLELGYSHLKFSNYYNNIAYNLGPSITEDHQTINQNIYRIVPGIQWNFAETKKIKAYCGMTISYNQYSKANYYHKVEVWDISHSNLTQGYIDTYKAKGGFTSGIGSFFGFNIQLLKNISVGAESSVSLLYNHLGGSYTSTMISLTNPNDISSSTDNASSKGIQFSTILPSLNITIGL